MTEILLTGTLSLNSNINQHPQHNIKNLFACRHFSFIQGFSACFMKMSVLTYTFHCVLFIICLRPIELLAIACFNFQHRPPNPDSKVIKVSKGAKIRNRYNQVPHLTQDTNWKVTKLFYAQLN